MAIIEHEMMTKHVTKKVGHRKTVTIVLQLLVSKKTDRPSAPSFKPPPHISLLLYVFLNHDLYDLSLVIVSFPTHSSKHLRQRNEQQFPLK